MVDNERVDKYSRFLFSDIDGPGNISNSYSQINSHGTPNYNNNHNINNNNKLVQLKLLRRRVKPKVVLVQDH